MKHIPIDKKLHEEFKEYCEKNCIIMSKLTSMLIKEWLLSQKKCQPASNIDSQVDK